MGEARRDALVPRRVVVEAASGGHVPASRREVCVALRAWRYTRLVPPVLRVKLPYDVW